MRRFVLASIRFYQKYLSFDTGILKFLFLTGQSLPAGRQACRFSPRCSEYTYQAVERYGIIYGSWLGVRRIARCHPWNKGGHDPLPNIHL
jgi:putative membrane protein insertion efficiency factor